MGDLQPWGKGKDGTLPPQPPCRLSSLRLLSWSSVARGSASHLAFGSRNFWLESQTTGPKPGGAVPAMWRGHPCCLSGDSEHLQRERGQSPHLQDKPLKCRAALQVLREPALCVRQAWQFLKFFEMF